MDPLIKILTKSGPKTGTGLVGKTFCHQTMSGVNVHFKDRWLNPFLAAGASETCIDEFNEATSTRAGSGSSAGTHLFHVTSGRPIVFSTGTHQYLLWSARRSTRSMPATARPDR